MNYTILVEVSLLVLIIHTVCLLYVPELHVRRVLKNASFYSFDLNPHSPEVQGP